MSVYPDAKDRSVWRFRDKSFDTKLEMERFAEGYYEGLRDCEKQRKQEFHQRGC